MRIPLQLRLPSYRCLCHRALTIWCLIPEAFELGGGKGHCSAARCLLEVQRSLGGMSYDCIKGEVVLFMCRNLRTVLQKSVYIKADQRLAVTIKRAVGFVQEKGVLVKFMELSDSMGQFEFHA